MTPLRRFQTVRPSPRNGEVRPRSDLRCGHQASGFIPSPLGPGEDHIHLPVRAMRTHKPLVPVEKRRCERHSAPPLPPDRARPGSRILCSILSSGPARPAFLSIISGAPEDLTGGRPNARAAAMNCLTDPDHLATVADDRLGRRALRAHVLGFRDAARARLALRGDLTQAELKTAWNAGLNDAARRHRGGIEIQGETKG